MSGGVWLKCDHCNKELKIEADQEMQLAVRFKPSLMKLDLGRLRSDERLHRCPGCGWVNVFVPAASASGEQERNPLLTPNWRRVTLKS